jgi:L-iditol 2-dehydrogenase
VFELLQQFENIFKKGNTALLSMKSTTLIENQSRGVRRSPSLIFEAPGKVSIGNREVPFPSKGQLRIQVVACGICQREIHVLQGKVTRSFPTVMGHEPVGIIDTVGPEVEGFRVGQWVTGVGTSSLAKYDLVEAKFMAPLEVPPLNPSHWLGEPAMCAINAANRPLWRRNPVVVVWGAGFMGNLLVQAIRIKWDPKMLVAVDIDRQRLGLALEAGADRAVMADVKDIKRILPHPVDIVYEASGALGTISICTSLLRNGGTLCIFAHHFAIEPEVISQWHLRGLTVLNTVPWSAPNLGDEVREAVTALQRRKLRMDHLIGRSISFSNAPETLSTMACKNKFHGKTVVLIP